MTFPVSLYIDGHDIDGTITVSVTTRDTSFSHALGTEKVTETDVEFVEFSTPDSIIAWLNLEEVESAAEEWVANHRTEIIERFLQCNS